MNNLENSIYLELPAKALAQTKIFFKDVFGWTFVDYGTEYTAFSHNGISGGFYKSDLTSTSANGSVLIVFYSHDLETIQAKITAAGGIILKSTYAFPGGRRFHFSDPNGNEYAVWSDQ